ncbi:Putative peptidoglycan binding domain-containing protein [Carnobacterium iners]|uniref:Putative peptidoglycan binding domain-containing protein n=1 Tax=Carnobacterium iners TaxID=1073423 RepID=A0A1X7NBF7_9LACT|nr:peptidoglycan-binding protein [Carnobacterium iners]SEL10871.1 Putative peptidoglycan binding domain-containing protein [Carnobacterium iners]SMH34962.1 Putative peptidoglycan binding domain-containing protein [Carnobacterium iners]
MSNQIEKRLIVFKQYPLIKSTIIIAHESGNALNTGKNALENELTFMAQQALKGGAFVSHWVGGGGKIVQLSKTGFVQYGAGANANAYAYAQVELARTSDPLIFKKDYLAYVWLLKKLANEAGIPRTLNTGKTLKEKGIKTHHWVSIHLGGTNHRDPDDYLASFGISLNQFAFDLDNYKKEDSLVSNLKNETHIVKFGDTLWSIAKKNKTTVTWLKKLNQLSSDQIQIGTVLLLTKHQAHLPSANHSLKERRDIIKQIQKNCGTIVDGVFGPNTKKALLCLFQETIRTEIDGLWGPKTASLVRNIQLGTSGNDVYAVQAMLFGRGYEIVGIPNRLAGRSTKQAILLFQKERHLICDGIAGKKTLALLFQ